ncbi:MAG: Uma2 family endonuclease [Bryobacteraceae bacterium]
MAASTQTKLSPAEYLALDRASDLRHEYVDGLMVAMSGGTGRHSLLIGSFSRLLGNALFDRQCAVSVTELRLQVTQGGAYLYPDIMVICGSFQYADSTEDIVLNPTVIVEVLSDSTERWDRNGKFAKYMLVPTLREYVLVSQDKMCIEWFTRRDNGEWVPHAANGPEAVCRLESLDIALPLAEVYRRIELARSPSP